jgi:hypothetical protein
MKIQSSTSHIAPESCVACLDSLPGYVTSWNNIILLPSIPKALCMMTVQLALGDTWSGLQ